MSMLSKLAVAASIADFAVKKFFFDLLKIDTVVAAGSLISDAAVLSSGRNMVTGANGTKAVRLPKSEPDSKVEIVNTVSNAALILFPELAADQINAVTAGASFSIPGGARATCYCDVAGHWYVSVAVSSTPDAVELAYIDIVTLGTGAPSKAVVLDASGNYIMPDNGMFGLSRAAVAAAGTDATNATVLADQVNAVTGADGTTGVALPAAATTTGPIYVINTVLTSGADLKVYPINGGNDNINGGAEDAAFVMGPGKAAWFIPTSATQWYVEDAAGVLATKTELNYLDIVTLGTLAASKAWTSDANLDTVMPTGGKLTVQSGADITFNAGSTHLVNTPTTTTAAAAEHGAGAIGTGIAPVTTRWTDRGVIVTQTKIDLEGLASVATANDVIGLSAGGAAYIGRNVEATNGVIFKVEFACLETPTGGDNDVNVVANANAALAYDGAGGTTYLSNSGDLLKGQTIDNLVPALTEGDYFYLTAGTGDTAAAYTAGMYVLTTYGHAALA